MIFVRKKQRRHGRKVKKLGMLAYGNVMIPIGLPSKFPITRPKSATVSICSLRKWKPVTTTMVDHTSKPTVPVRFHFVFHHLLGAMNHIFLSPKRFDPYKQETGPSIMHLNGNRKVKNFDGTKHGKSLAHGSRIHASINHNACFIQKVGLLVNLISFFDGMETYGSSISNLDTVVHPFQKVFNTNFGSMHGFGQEPTKKESCNRWKVGIFRAMSESNTMHQVTKNLHQWTRSSFTSMRQCEAWEKEHQNCLQTPLLELQITFMLAMERVLDVAGVVFLLRTSALQVQ